MDFIKRDFCCKTFLLGYQIIMDIIPRAKFKKIVME